MRNGSRLDNWRIRGEITTHDQAVKRTVVVTALVILFADLMDLVFNIIFAPYQIVRSAIQTTLISGVLGTIVVYTMARANLKLYRMKMHLAQLTRLDSHTGLLNRRAFIEIAEAVSQGPEPHVLMLVDIDDFKQINDTHGHPTGDRVIAELARLMQEYFLDGASAARMGGEEFSALLMHADPANALSQARGFLERVAGHDFSPDETGLLVTFSAGLAALVPGKGFAEAYAQADRAMYQAKSLGGGRVMLYDRNGAIVDQVSAVSNRGTAASNPLV